MRNKNLHAFTLAEVLITLGIIGVVAALTMPTLIKNYEKKVIVTRMQKFYTTFNDALRRSVAENGDMTGWTFPTSYYDAIGSETFFNTYLAKNMQYVKTKSNVRTIWPTDGIMVWLNDGSAFVFSGGPWVTFYPRASKSKIAGVDVFLFYIVPDKNAIMPHGYDNIYLNKNGINHTGPTRAGMACSPLVENANNRSCSAYIMKNNWTFPDYYPFDELRRRKL